MVDTPRTIAYLAATSFPTNGIGGITAQNSRDLVVTLDSLTSTVSVKQYGALGDGSTNDTTAFNNAISAGAKTVFVPSGTYIVGSVALNQAITLYLSRGATLKAPASLNSRVINVTAAGARVMGEGTIDANRANNTSSRGIWVNSVADVVIDGITVKSSNEIGIVGTDCNNIRISNCYVTDTGWDGINVQNTVAASTISDVLIYNNFVDRSAENPAATTAGGLKVLGSGALPATMLRPRVIANRVFLPAGATASGNVCIEIYEKNISAVTAHNITQGGLIGISYTIATAGSVVGNICYASSALGIEIAGSYKCTVSANTIYGNGVTAQGIEANDMTVGVNYGNSIIGNSIDACTGSAIRFYKANTGSATGNTCRTSLGAGQVYMLYASNEVSITGGEVDGQSSAGYAVNLNDCSNITISGLNIHDMATGGVLLWVDVAGTYDNVMVSGCTFVNTTPVMNTSLTTGTIGNNCAVINCTGVVGASSSNGNARRGNCLDWKNQVWDFIGSGTPVSSVTAGPGSTYRNQAGGTTTTYYVKESGTGTTVWVAK